MAGKIIADTIQTEASFLQLNVSTTRIATMNASGIYSNTGTKMMGYDGTIGVATIANTAIDGVITATQLAANSVNSSIIAANTVTNTNLQTGSIENYFVDNSFSLGMRNRIINGDMRIDQRNAGASVGTGSGNDVYTLDRWQAVYGFGNKYTIQRSTTTASGFINSLLVTSSAATSTGAGDIYHIGQTIEGFNVADLGWGAAGAKTITLSFWVRSSLTGTFGGALQNSANNRSYPFTFTISVADTFEYKTVTIAGDTSGTWLTDNGVGIKVRFNLGSGSTYSGTAGAWSSSDFRNATGATSVLATNGATFYITGVQLEVGSVATPFERRPYGTELMLCQRYFEKSVDISSAILTNTLATFYGNMPSSIANNNWYLTFPFKVTKRAAPTVTTYPYTTAANTSRFSNNGGTDYGANSAVPNGIYDSQFSIVNNSGGALSVGAGIVFGSWFASAEL